MTTEPLFFCPKSKRSDHKKHKCINEWFYIAQNRYSDLQPVNGAPTPRICVEHTGIVIANFIHWMFSAFTESGLNLSCCDFDFSNNSDSSGDDEDPTKKEIKIEQAEIDDDKNDLDTDCTVQNEVHAGQNANQTSQNGSPIKEELNESHDRELMPPPSTPIHRQNVVKVEPQVQILFYFVKVLCNRRTVHRWTVHPWMVHH